MQQANRESKILWSIVVKWHKGFSDGREIVKDDKRCGQNTIIDARMIYDIKTSFNTDRRQKLLWRAPLSPTYIYAKLNIAVTLTAISNSNNYWKFESISQIYFMLHWKSTNFWITPSILCYSTTKLRDSWNISDAR